MRRYFSGYQAVNKSNINQRWLICMAMGVLSWGLAMGAPAHVSAAAKHAHPQALAPWFAKAAIVPLSADTSSKQVQHYFKQGLALFYGFEYGEAIRSLKASVRLDPKCARCAWALALVLGSKTDMPLSGKEQVQARQWVKKAKRLLKPGDAKGRAYIDALMPRYAGAKQPIFSRWLGLSSSDSQIDPTERQHYADAMQALVKRYPQDVDAKVLAAAAWFDVMSWHFWQKPTGAPKPQTQRVIDLLEDALLLSPDHPGANHFYVHLMEYSPWPKLALPSADRLPNILPMSQHLAHMPCHIAYRLGDYHAGVLANQQAIKRAHQVEGRVRQQGFTAPVQYLHYHNYEYLIASAYMSGESMVARQAATALAKQTLPLVKKNLAMQAWLVPNLLAPLRFGDWVAVLRAPQPSAKMAYVLGVWHYARGVAYAQRQQWPQAQAEMNALDKILALKNVEAKNYTLGQQKLTIARASLAGLLALHRGNKAEMQHQFAKAIQVQDLEYEADPPKWYCPVRQLYGGVLLALGDFPAAADVFQQDLARNPNNGWSLYGWLQAERHLGDVRQVQRLYARFRHAWRYADITKPVFLR